MDDDTAHSVMASIPNPRATAQTAKRFRRAAEPAPLSSMALGTTHTLVKEHGERGLFAREDIAQGDVVVVFGGRAIDIETLETLPRDRQRFALQIEEGAFLYSDFDGPGDWVNHSCAPNVGMRGQIVLVAMRPIQAGQELCFDYAMTDVYDYDSFVCQCGAAGCRERVGPDDWQRPELQQRYDGYFAPHVARRIAASHQR